MGRISMAAVAGRRHARGGRRFIELCRFRRVPICPERQKTGLKRKKMEINKRIGLVDILKITESPKGLRYNGSLRRICN